MKRESIVSIKIRLAMLIIAIAYPSIMHSAAATKIERLHLEVNYVSRLITEINDAGITHEKLPTLIKKVSQGIATAQAALTDVIAEAESFEVVSVMAKICNKFAGRYYEITPHDWFFPTRDRGNSKYYCPNTMIHLNR